jgi:hypothetical protein
MSGNGGDGVIARTTAALSDVAVVVKGTSIAKNQES